MAKQSLRLILSLFAALGVACGSDGKGGFEPRPPRPEPPEPEPSVFTRLEVTPTAYSLATVAPGNTLQLTIRAYDQTGALMPNGAATYTSTAPAIAGVTSGGVVTATAPGTAEITATLTLGGVPRTASMTVTVYAIDFSDIAGVYDLTALVKSFDPAWGEDLTGYRYTAVLTVRKEGSPPWFGGTYADLRLIGPGGDSYYIADTGSLSVSTDFRGRLVVELAHDQNPAFHLTLLVATLGSGFIDGTFGHAHIGGTFTATRR